jgi:hypothetical protein
MFIDEFGNSKLQDQDPTLQDDYQDQPFIIITGVVIPVDSLSELTNELVRAKRNFFPKAVKGGNN